MTTSLNLSNDSTIMHRKTMPLRSSAQKLSSQNRTIQNRIPTSWHPICWQGLSSSGGGVTPLYSDAYAAIFSAEERSTPTQHRIVYTAILSVEEKSSRLNLPDASTWSALDLHLRRHLHLQSVKPAELQEMLSRNR
jgi:hypothetical protein